MTNVSLAGWLLARPADGVASFLIVTFLNSCNNKFIMVHFLLGICDLDTRPSCCQLKQLLKNFTFSLTPHQAATSSSSPGHLLIETNPIFYFRSCIVCCLLHSRPDLVRSPRMKPLEHAAARDFKTLCDGPMIQLLGCGVRSGVPMKVLNLGEYNCFQW